MKKILLLTLLSICSIAILKAQNKVDFTLQADGNFINKADKKDFAIINIDGKTQKELFSEVMVAVSKLYNSPKDVLSKVDDEMISINGISKDCIDLKGWMGVHVLFSIQYVLKFQFKDGRIKIDAPYISRFFSDGASDITPFSGWLSTQKVFKDGMPNPKKQSTIDDFNNTLNGLINSIISNMGQRSANNDW